MYKRQVEIDARRILQRLDEVVAGHRLTVFRDQEFSSDRGSRAVERIAAVSYLRSAQFPEDAGPMAHPVRPDEYIEINNFYTTTVYEKGAEVIRMLPTLLGPEAVSYAHLDVYKRQQVSR